MQQQTAEALCIQLRLGQSALVSLPSEAVPKRVNWMKWADGVSTAMRVKKNRSLIAPRLCMSPDHEDSKDNLTFMSNQNQSGLEQVDLFKLISSASDEDKFLFVGSWMQTLPSWFRSLQAVFSAKYGSVLQNFLAQQMKSWDLLGDRLETRDNFLVVDDVGRLSALASISKLWRSRQARANILTETRSASWFAATMELHMAKSSDGEAIRLHRLRVFKPDEWCGSPRLAKESFPGAPDLKLASQIWVSAPGAGMGLWIADQYELVDKDIQKLQMPSAVLGWHPLRDLIAFLSAAPSTSVMFMVDADMNLQVLMKESEGNS